MRRSNEGDYGIEELEPEVVRALSPSEKEQEFFPGAKKGSHSERPSPASKQQMQ
jgi:hypothetical protein